jgi:hypothetical protein
MGRLKKNPQTTEQAQSTEFKSARETIVRNLERNRIKEVISNFAADRTPMIERHLEQVKRNTGNIESEDVAYVMNLFTRELNHLIQDNAL